MNTERQIVQNALQLLINKNDPTLFDNPDVFESNLIENGAMASSSEVNALKASLKQRIPWEIRKKANNLTIEVVNEISAKFAQKFSLENDISLWTINAWITVLGLKIKEETSDNKPPEEVLAEEAIDKILDNVTNDKKEEVSISNGITKSSSRLGIVLGEDNTGGIKVFNTWYKEAPEEETYLLAAQPVKIEPVSVKPFRTAPLKKKKQEKSYITKTKTVTNSSATITNNANINSTNAVKSVANSDYIPGQAEQQAYDMLNQGAMFAEKALRILAPIAVGGSVLACRTMGEVYYKGYGVIQNFQAAYAWLKLSAAKNDAQSLFLMGNLYQFGMGVDKNLNSAKQCFEKAASFGHPKAAEALKTLSSLGL